MNLELTLEGGLSFSMSHSKREIVPDRRTDERKGLLSLEVFASVWNTEDASVSRGAESA